MSFLLWPNMTSDPRIKRPGYELTINTYNQPDEVFVLSVEIDFSFPGADQFSGIEVYNQFGTLCGQLMRPPVQGERVIFSCIDTYTPDDIPGTDPIYTTNGGMSIRFLGGGSIWDIPETTIDPDIIISDPVQNVTIMSVLADIFNAGFSVTPAYSPANLLFNTMSGFLYDLYGLGTIMNLANLTRPFPQRSGSFTSELFNNGSFINLQLNYTIGNSGAGASGALIILQIVLF